VQDVTGEEGTGIWSNEQAVTTHIPAPTLTVAHYFRLASSDRRQRRKAQEAMGGDFPAQKMEVKNKEAFIEDLRLAVFASCLASFIQGLNIIDKANREHHWNINFDEILQIWSGGCIIQADYIKSLLQPVFKDFESKKTINLLLESHIMNDIKKSKPSLQRIVGQAIQTDHVVPAMSATLEYIKYQTSLGKSALNSFMTYQLIHVDLPTSFYEAQLDFFGNHMYDRKDDDPEEAPVEGKHSFEWKKA